MTSRLDKYKFQTCFLKNGILIVESLSFYFFNFSVTNVILIHLFLPVESVCEHLKWK
jgi:hypothetical protein